MYHFRVRKIRDVLIKIPLLEKLGTMRREVYTKIFQRGNKEEYADIDLIKAKYRTATNFKGDKDKTYYIVYSQQLQGGLFVYIIDCLSQIAYARSKGYIPVVDMLNFPCNLKNKAQKGVNAWELYFRQPGGGKIKIEDVYGAPNIVFHNDEVENLVYIGDVFSDSVYQEWKYVFDESKEYSSWLENQEYMGIFRKFWKENMVYSDAAKQYIEEKYEIFRGKGKVLGLLCRGTDYLSLKPRGHYVQPSLRMIQDKVKEVMEEYYCDTVFCVTEDAYIYRKMQEFLGDKLIGLDVERVKYKEGYLLKDLYIMQHMDLFQQQMDYLTEMELLSRCPCLILGKTTGSRVLPIMKDKDYEYLYFWELGRYS